MRAKIEAACEAVKQASIKQTETYHALNAAQERVRKAQKLHDAACRETQSVEYDLIQLLRVEARQDEDIPHDTHAE